MEPHHQISDDGDNLALFERLRNGYIQLVNFFPETCSHKNPRDESARVIPPPWQQILPKIYSAQYRRERNSNPVYGSVLVKLLLTWGFM